MLSKLICAAVVAASANANSIHAREAPVYLKVNRDSEYGAPAAPSYSAPAPSYEAPAPSYSAPAPSYSAPEASYGAPSTGYGAPSYEEEGGLDLTSIIIPLLALVGLSLLFPTYVSLTSVRKRREAGDFEGKRKRTHTLNSSFYFTQQILHTPTNSHNTHYTKHNHVQQTSLCWPCRHKHGQRCTRFGATRWGPWTPWWCR